MVSEYNPANDADESIGHLCNSLNAEMGWLRHLSNLEVDVIPISPHDADRLSCYLERAQLIIEYLRNQLSERESVFDKFVELGERYDLSYEDIDYLKHINA